MAATTHSKLTELLDKFDGLLKRSSELINERRKKLLETEEYKPMEEHRAIFQVVEKELYKTKYSGIRMWKYKCILLDGPHAGRVIFTWRRKGLNEYVLGKYAGLVVQKSLGDGRIHNDIITDIRI